MPLQYHWLSHQIPQDLFLTHQYQLSNETIIGVTGTLLEHYKYDS